jgi:hypothetical protein
MISVPFILPLMVWIKDWMKVLYHNPHIKIETCANLVSASDRWCGSSTNSERQYTKLY